MLEQGKAAGAFHSGASKHEEVHVRLSTVSLAARYYQASVVKPNQPIRSAIFVHGFAGEQTEGGLFSLLASSLSAQGINALTYNCRRIGRSEGEYSRTSLATHTEDFQEMSRWLMRRSGNSSQQVCAIGFSLGSAIVGLACAAGTRLGALAYLSPATRPAISMWPRYQDAAIWEEIRATGRYTKPGSSIPIGEQNLIDLRDTDLGPNCFNVPCPLLVLHGSADTRIPIDHTEEALAHAAFRLTYVRLEGASHSLRPSELYWHRVSTALTDWISYVSPPFDAAPTPQS